MNGFMPITQRGYFFQAKPQEKRSTFIMFGEIWYAMLEDEVPEFAGIENFEFKLSLVRIQKPQFTLFNEVVSFSAF